MPISYLENTLVPHFSEAEVASMKRMLSLDLPGFDFDPKYLDHIRAFNGGKPGEYFRTRGGRAWPIDRFLNTRIPLR